MDEERRQHLKWLADQYITEQRNLRAAEDNLFNWSISLFFAGLGALTGLRGMTDRGWGLTWRLLIMLGLIAIVTVILLMAYLIRRNYEQTQAALADVATQLNPSGAPAYLPVQAGYASGEKQYFYVRWGALGVLGVVTLGLVWMLG